MRSYYMLYYMLFLAEKIEIDENVLQQSDDGSKTKPVMMFWQHVKISQHNTWDMWRRRKRKNIQMQRMKKACKTCSLSTEHTFWFIENIHWLSLEKICWVVNLHHHNKINWSIEKEEEIVISLDKLL